MATVFLWEAGRHIYLRTGARSALKAFHASIPIVLPLDNYRTRTNAQIAGRRFRVPAQDQIGSVYFDLGTAALQILNRYDPGHRTPFQHCIRHSIGAGFAAFEYRLDL